jgi:hypothetical protein
VEVCTSGLCGCAEEGCDGEESEEEDEDVEDEEVEEDEEEDEEVLESKCKVWGKCTSEPRRMRGEEERGDGDEGMIMGQW